MIGGTSREIFFNQQYSFATSLHTIGEVEKYIPYISKKTGLNIELIFDALKLLPIKTYNQSFYSDKLAEAEEKIGKIDEKDVDILALTLKTSKILWSTDKHFDGIEGIILLRTKDFI